MKKTFLSFSIIFISLLLYSCNETTGPACNNNLPTVIAQLYDCGPDVDNCNAGVLKSSEKIKVMDLFNRIRSYHKLQEISYNPDDEVYAQEAALITCSNDSMNHQPPNNVKCFSQNGYKGCDEGNLWYGSATQVYEWKSENMILDWLIDDNVETLGHRRWLLNPFMRNAAYGRVDKVLSSGRHVTAVVLKVFDRLVYAPPFESNIEYVAYPDGDYPSNAFKNDWFLSFSVVADKVDFWNNKNVDFSNSTIEMTDNNNNPISVNTVSFNTEGFGLPNIIQWKAVNLQSGVRYNVKIKKVKFQNSEKDYTYWFKLVSPI